MENLKVIMMGGRRCGKTSALASMFNQMIHTSELTDHLTVSDVTILDTKLDSNGNPEKQEALSNKTLELRNFFNRYRESDFLVDIGPTSNWWLYTLQISLAGHGNKNMRMEFRDSAGEFFVHGGVHATEVTEYVAGCDVFVVVIDTPYLMYDEEQAVAEAANVIDSIHSFICSIDTNATNVEPKQFIFVPIKCEKWLHEDRIDEVVNRVKELYASTINFLKHRGNTELSIIPIQTAGDIVFSRMKKPYVLVRNGETRECTKITERTVQLRDGKMVPLEEGDELREDINNTFMFVNIVRPLALFRHSNATPSYKPMNCEQITLHILRFMLNKARNGMNTNWFINFFRNIFGRITIDDLNRTIAELTSHGLIKDSGDGIERIKIYS